MIHDPSAEIEHSPLPPGSPAITENRSNSDSTDIHANTPLPFSLQIVALVHILIGAIGVIEMVLQAVIFEHPQINIFAPMAFLVGRGLLRREETWRRWALFFGWLFLVAGIGGIFVCIVTYAFSSSARVAESPDGLRGLWWGLGLSVLTTGYCWWQIRLLRRAKIIADFAAQHVERPLGADIAEQAAARRRWQFSLGTLLLAMGVTAFLLARLTSDDIRYKVENFTRTTAIKSGANLATTLAGLEYGVRVDRFDPQQVELTYVVLSESDHWQKNVETQGRSPYQSAWLRTPNNKSMPLPGKFQLYELADGELFSRKERVTLSELHDFMAKHRGAWTLDALIQHAETMRAKSGN